MTNQITPTTKVNLGILGTLIVVGFGCGVYLTDIRATVREGFMSTAGQLTEIRTALRDGSAAIAILNRSVATLEAKLEAIEKRVAALEAKAR
jgi:hypothetical protein